jgi:ABC-type molybdenum transport system ATPase subunit/photorepair protein PhrA
MNKKQLLHAVLMDPELKKLGGYSEELTEDFYRALNSNNYVVSAVARIIDRHENDTSDTALYKELNDYLQEKV